MKLSLVITVFNEEDNIEPLMASISESLSDLNYEVVFVDDGSTDQTVVKIKEQADPCIKLVILTRNYGQTAAMTAGIDQATGDYIVTLDGDLQNDPADIPMMVKQLQKEDCDVVAGWRKNRKDNILRKIPSSIANGIIRWLTGVQLRDYGCTLKVFKSQIAKNLGLYGELHRFIPVLAHMQGANMIQVPVNHHHRKYGTSKYGIGRAFKVASDLMLMVFFQKYLQKPMHLFGTLGLFSFMTGSVISAYLLVIKLMGEDIWGRPLLILGITMLLGGIQLITIGFVAELIIRTYYESQDKKTYRVKEVFSTEEVQSSVSSASRISAN